MCKIMLTYLINFTFECILLNLLVYCLFIIDCGSVLYKSILILRVFLTLVPIEYLVVCT